MIKHRVIEKPAFNVIGKKTWISSQDNDLFGQFWVQCQEEGLFKIFEQLSSNLLGAQTKSSTLGISCVEKDPANRSFYYIIAIEKPAGYAGQHADELEIYHVPTSQWVVFECVGKVPEAIVKSEIYAFTEWLPSSGYEHAKAPEMEVYFPENDGISADNYCEFWLPVIKK
ncbi:MAG: GyrI-like domain-containing protein [Anaerolineales bacterium]|nr:GyrI-like domain-containing protein [Anaerolineales bacterium]